MKKQIKTMDKLPEPQGKYGYTDKEIRAICRKLKIGIRKFWVAFGINTCALDGGVINYYPWDVERALWKLGEKKLGKNYMWD